MTISVDPVSAIAKLAPEYLVVVPDGALHQLPLEALQLNDEPARYVFDLLPAIVYAPSLAIMSILSERQQSQARGPLSLLTVGDPRYPSTEVASTRSLGATASDDYLQHLASGRLSRLPFTKEECGRVARALVDVGHAPSVHSDGVLCPGK